MSQLQVHFWVLGLLVGKEEGPAWVVVACWLVVEVGVGLGGWFVVVSVCEGRRVAWEASHQEGEREVLA